MLLTLEGAQQLEEQSVTGGAAYSGGIVSQPVLVTDSGGYIAPSVSQPEVISSAPPPATKPTGSSCDTCSSPAGAVPGQAVPIIGTGTGFISPPASFSLSSAELGATVPTPATPAEPAHTPQQLVDFFKAHGSAVLLALLALALLVAYSNARGRR